MKARGLLDRNRLYVAGAAVALLVAWLAGDSHLSPGQAGGLRGSARSPAPAHTFIYRYHWDSEEPGLAAERVATITAQERLMVALSEPDVVLAPHSR